eukprot:3013059-Rhodomonas_salina.2
MGVCRAAGCGGRVLMCAGGEGSLTGAGHRELTDWREGSLTGAAHRALTDWCMALPVTQRMMLPDGHVWCYQMIELVGDAEGGDGDPSERDGPMWYVPRRRVRDVTTEGAGGRGACG